MPPTPPTASVHRTSGRSRTAGAGAAAPGRRPRPGPVVDPGHHRPDPSPPPADRLGRARLGTHPARRAERAHPDERDPQLLDTTVARVVADRGWELELRVRGVFARWPELVGPEVAAHATPSPSPTGGWWCAPTPRRGRPSCGCSRRPSYAGSTRSSGPTPSP
ncbi:MAG: DciA family protein [Nocardioides sp.]